jgi:membrane protease YdiL (CAAX protease family)
MQQYRLRQYPTIIQSVHLIILYIFIQTLVDFPLALIDYYKDTEYLYHPIKKIVLGIGSTVFILWYGFKNTGNPLKEVFPLKKFNPILILLLITFFAGIQQLLNIVNQWVDQVIPPPAWFWELFSKIFESDFGFFGAFMKVVIIAPVVEELIFRGVIMYGLMRNYSKAKAIFFSGLLFALFHLNPWQFPATFILGILLGWIMIRTKNIGLAIIGHAINNLLVLLSITFHEELEGILFSRIGDLTLNASAALLAIISVFGIYYFSGQLKKKTSN